MTNRIPDERLISIASGESQPTPNEKLALQEDYRSREALREYQELYADLEGMPAAELDDETMSGILPGVRQQIHSPNIVQRLAALLPTIGSLAWRPVAAAAAVFIFVLMPALMLSGPPELEQLTAGDLAAMGYDTEEFLYEGELEMTMEEVMGEFVSVDSDLADTAVDQLYAETSVYNLAAGLSEEELASLNRELEAELNF